MTRVVLSMRYVTHRLRIILAILTLSSFASSSRCMQPPVPMNVRAILRQTMVAIARPSRIPFTMPVLLTMSKSTWNPHDVLGAVELKVWGLYWA